MAEGNFELLPPSKLSQDFERRHNILKMAAPDLASKPEVAYSILGSSVSDDEIRKYGSQLAFYQKMEDEKKDLDDLDYYSQMDKLNSMDESTLGALVQMGFVPKEEEDLDEPTSPLDTLKDFAGSTLGNILEIDPIKKVLQGANILAQNVNRAYRASDFIAREGGPNILQFDQAWDLAGGGTGHGGGKAWWDPSGGGEGVVRADIAQAVSRDLGDPLKYKLALALSGGQSVVEFAESGEAGLLPIDPGYTELVQKLYFMQDEEEITAAKEKLHNYKISFGRDFAHFFGIHQGAAFNVVSGGADATWAVVADPTLIGGKALKATRLIHRITAQTDMVAHVSKQVYGTTASSLVVGATPEAGVGARRTILGPRTTPNPKVVRAAETMVEHANAGTYAQLRTAMPQIASGIDDFAQKMQLVRTRKLRDAGVGDVVPESIDVSDIAARLDVDREVIEPLKGKTFNQLQQERDVIVKRIDDLTARTDEEVKARIASGLSDADDDIVWRAATAEARKVRSAIDELMDAVPKDEAQKAASLLTIDDVAEYWTSTSFRQGIIEGRWRTPGYPVQTLPMVSKLREKVLVPLKTEFHAALDFGAHPEFYVNQWLDEVIGNTTSSGLWTVTKENLGLVGFLNLQTRATASKFLKGFITQIPKARFINPDDPDASAVFGSILDYSLPYQLRDDILNDFIRFSGNFAEQKRVYAQGLDTMFTAAGAKTTDAGKEMVEKFLQRLDHRYAAGKLDQMEVGIGRPVTEALYVTDLANQWEIPAFRELLDATRSLTWTRKTVGHLNTGIVEGFMTKYWKPAMLLKIGFIPRAYGEEMLGFIFREGGRSFLKAHAAASWVKEGEALPLFRPLYAVSRAAQKGTRYVRTGDAWARHTWLDYASHEAREFAGKVAGETYRTAAKHLSRDPIVMAMMAKNIGSKDALYSLTDIHDFSQEKFINVLQQDGPDLVEVKMRNISDTGQLYDKSNILYAHMLAERLHKLNTDPLARIRMELYRRKVPTGVIGETLARAQAEGLPGTVKELRTLLNQVTSGTKVLPMWERWLRNSKMNNKLAVKTLKQAGMKSDDATKLVKVLGSMNERHRTALFTMDGELERALRSNQLADVVTVDPNFREMIDMGLVVDPNKYVTDITPLQRSLPENVEESLSQYSLPGVEAQEKMQTHMPVVIDFQRNSPEYQEELNRFLDDLGVGDEVILFRGGPINAQFGTTNVSLSPDTARIFARLHAGTNDALPTAYRVRRDAIVGHGDPFGQEFFVDVDGMIPERDLDLADISIRTSVEDSTNKLLDDIYDSIEAGDAAKLGQHIEDIMFRRLQADDMADFRRRSLRASQLPEGDLVANPLPAGNKRVYTVMMPPSKTDDMSRRIVNAVDPEDRTFVAISTKEVVQAMPVEDSVVRGGMVWYTTDVRQAEDVAKEVGERLGMDPPRVGYTDVDEEMYNQGVADSKSYAPGTANDRLDQQVFLPNTQLPHIQPLDSEYRLISEVGDEEGAKVFARMRRVAEKVKAQPDITLSANQQKLYDQWQGKALSVDDPFGELTAEDFFPRTVAVSGIDQNAALRRWIRDMAKDMDGTFNPGKNLDYLAHQALEDNFSTRTLHQMRMEDLPTQTVGPTMAIASKEPWHDRWVRRGFDEIAKAGDGIIRNKMFIHYYAQSLEQIGPNAVRLFGDPATITALDSLAFDLKLDDVDIQNLRSQWDELDEATRAARNPEEFFRLNDPVPPPLRGLTQEQLDKVRTLYIEVKEVGDPDALKQLDKIMRKTDYTGRDVVAMVDSLPYDMKLSFKNNGFISEDFPEMLKGLTPQQFDVVRMAQENLQFVDEQIKRTSMTRAVNDVVPWIDDPRVRSQYQQFVRNVVPFHFAEEAFIKRMIRTAKFHPEAIRKAQLTFKGMEETGYFYENQYGETIFNIPFTGALANMLFKIGDFWKPMQMPFYNNFTGQVQYSLPGLDRYGFPSFSPIIGLPLAIARRNFPELREVERMVMGERGAGRSVPEMVLPSFAHKIASALINPESLISSQITAAQYLEANGDGFPENGTSDEKERWNDRVVSWSRGINLLKGIFSFVSPAAPTVDVPEQLAPEFTELLKVMPMQDALAAFMKRNPDARGYTIFKSESVSGAPLPATEAAYNSMRDNETFYRRHKEAGPWLLPPGNYKEEFHRAAYNEALIMDLREKKDFDEWVRDVKTAQAADLYFESSENADIAIAGAANDPIAKRQIRAEWKEWKEAYFKEHPIFAEEIQQPDARQRRQQTIDKLGAALDDPEVPKAAHAPKLRLMLESYNNMRKVIEEHPGHSSINTSIREGTLEQGKLWFEKYIMENPEIKPFYDRVLRMQLGLDPSTET